MRESLDDKKRERDKYVGLVDSDIKSINFRTNAHIEFLKFLGSTILVGFFFMWSSSNSDSNFFKMLEHNKIFLYCILSIPYLCYIVFLICLIKSAYARRGELDLNFYQKYSFQKELFARFLLKKMGWNKEVNYKKIIKNYEECVKNIEFNFFEFRDFVESYITKKYKFDFPIQFFEHFSYLILYNEDIEGTLISEDNEYIFIVQKNEDFILHMIKVL